MAQSLGSLYVELAANTAKFVGPLSDAARAAKAAASDISREFSSLQRVASQTFGAFGEFNPVISQLSFAFSQAGRAASEAMGSFGKIHTGLGAIAAMSAGATAALGSVAVGALAVAVHATESAAKLYEMSQATGVSVEALSGLGFAAKQAGLSQETLATGLERMDRSAFAAATAPIGATNAYTRLGVSVKDSAGNLRSTESIFEDVAAKFAAMADGPAKTALAIQLFGRSGAELIPMLNQGSQAINGWVAAARSMGLVISGETAESAEHFQQTLGVLSGVVEGLANKLMVPLLPTLQLVADAIENDLGKGPNTSWIVEMAKQFVAACADMILVARMLHADLMEFTLPVTRLNEKWKEDIKGNLVTAPFKDVGAIVDFVGSEVAGDSKEADDYYKQAVKDHDDFIAKLSAPAAGPMYGPPKPKLPGEVGGPDKKLGMITSKDTVSDLVAKLQAQTAAELALAAATGLSAAALVAQKAAGEADVKIAEARTELLDRELRLNEQLSDTKTNPKGSDAARRIQNEIDGVKKLVDELDRDVPLIRNSYLEIAAAQEATRIGNELTKEGQGFDRQIDSLQGLAAAYKSGSGAAIANSEIDKQLEEDKQRVAELRELFNSVDASDPSNSAALGALGKSLTQANAQLEGHRLQLERSNSASINAEIEKETRAFNDQSDAVSRLNEAYLQSAAAVRAAEVDVKVAQFKTDNPGASGDDIARVTAQLQREADQARQTTLSELSGEYELNRAYGDQLDKLNAIRAALIEAHQPTMLVDVAISQAGIDKIEQYRRTVFEAQNEELLGSEKLYDLQRQLNAEWDQAAIKVGSLKQAFEGLAGEIAAEGQGLSDYFATLKSSLDGLSGSIAQFVVTGKNGFKQWADQLAEGLLKDRIKNTFSQLASLGQTKQSDDEAAAVGIPDVGSALAAGPKSPASAAAGIAGAIDKIFGIKSPSGADSRPKGTQLDPIYVRLSSIGLPGNSPDGGGDSSGSGDSSGLSGILQKLGAPKTGTTPPFLPLSSLFNSDVNSSAVSDLGTQGMSGLAGGPPPPGGGGLGSLFSGIGSDFGKFGSSLWSGLSSAGSAVGSGISSFFSMFAGFFADGGQVSPGMIHAVGENGPELFVPHEAGTIFPSATAFAGFRADGGDVFPGRAYMVGEKRPEIFMPRSAIGRSSTPSSGSPSSGGDTHVHMNISGVTDADSFRRSRAQIYAQMHAQLALANSRNG